MSWVRTQDTSFQIQTEDGIQKKGGAQRASKHFDTKKETEQYSRELSRKEGSELFIHGKDGQIQRKDSHGNDPFPPKG